MSMMDVHTPLSALHSAPSSSGSMEVVMAEDDVSSDIFCVLFCFCLHRNIL
jgi:hypothetical protein